MKASAGVSPMIVHRSNRSEELARALAGVVKEPLRSVFEPEVVVVQSKGMERWLSLELSKHLGVLANTQFPFPRSFIEQAFGWVLGEESAQGVFGRDALSLALARLLSELQRQPAFAAVRSYLEDDPQGLKRLALAARIADLFDQYSVYRPDLVAGWERGESSEWQAELWRALLAAHGRHHLAARASEFVQAFRELGELPEEFPRRLSVFGISSLPPVYLSLLREIAQRVEVHLFQLSPSKEYWAEIRSQREILRELSRKGGGVAADAAELHLSQGNPLLASLGRSGREFAQLLESMADYQVSAEDLYRAPGRGSMLHLLQSDILELKQRGPGAEPPLPVDPGDNSVLVHSVHSPLREVEVLHDQLLALFEADPSLEARDVLVMAPDIDRYAPLIQAVFDRGTGEGLQIPYRIADKRQRGQSEVLSAVLSFLTLCDGRMKASEVLDLLQLSPVRRRFGIEAESLGDVYRWVHESGIRWGVDADDREQAGQPASATNTWRFGLDRLLLGCAIPESESTLFCGTLAYDGAEGSDAERLGRFAEFCEVVFRLRRELSAPRTLPEWVRALADLLPALVAADDEGAWQLKLLREVLSELGRHAVEVGFDDRLSLAAVHHLIDERISAERASHQFLAGGVTFCALLPMRSVPFRVVCLLGMNDGDFPRVDRSLSFDHTRTARRIGDRSLRDEDRYLFLEALLSARERFLIFYVGRSIKDNAELPPSVVVSELCSSIRDACLVRQVRPRQITFGFAEEQEKEPEILRRVVLEHPLQSFSPSYFRRERDPRLFSYSHAQALGARALVAPPRRHEPFQRAPLMLDELARRELSLDTLARFFENPARALLQTKLGVFLEDRPEVVEDREPIVLDDLMRYAVGEEVFERTLSGAELSKIEELLSAKGLLPPGAPGRHFFRELAAEVADVVRLARQFAGGKRIEPRALELELGGTRLSGVLNELHEGVQLTRRFARFRPKAELSAWVRHLALSCLDEPGLPRESVLVARPEKASQVGARQFHAIEPPRARRLLTELIELYWIGQRAPLCLFPESSKTYVVELSKRAADSDAKARALEAAWEVFAPPEQSYKRGESEDPYVQRLFDGVDPLDPGYRPFRDFVESGRSSFPELSRVVFEPLFANSAEHQA